MVMRTIQKDYIIYGSAILAAATLAVVSSWPRPMTDHSTIDLNSFTHVPEASQDYICRKIEHADSIMEDEPQAVPDKRRLLAEASILYSRYDNSLRELDSPHRSKPVTSAWASRSPAVNAEIHRRIRAMCALRPTPGKN